MAKFKNLRQLISVQGNGKIITKEFTVSSFLRLHLSISKEIEIHQSNEEKVVIEVDKNLADHIEITNFGGYRDGRRCNLIRLWQIQGLNGIACSRQTRDDLPVKMWWCRDQRKPNQ